MDAPAKIRTLTRVTVAVLAAAAGIAVLGWPPAQARVFVSAGVPFGYYGPGPYYGYGYGYPYSYPYAYYPPSAYYAPPAYSYYPQTYSAPAYPQTYSAPAPAAYTPPAGVPTAAAAPATRPAETNAVAAVTYTSKPAFTNASGRTCREYRTSSGGRDIFGTACQQADGQWRVVN